MKKLLTLLLLFIVGMTGMAQAPVTNTAFKNGEVLKYTLRFSVGPAWMDVGTAEWRVAAGTYNGQSGHKVTVRTMTNSRADRYFVLRDTMVTYVTPKLVPLYFDKKGREGKRYKRDWVKYSYSGGQCHVNSWHRTDKNTPKTCNYNSKTCAYDMVSMMIRARSLDASKWQVGHRESFILADGKHCTKQAFVYRGKQTIKLDGTKTKYRCLVFSYMDMEDGKESELVKFYISDDANHLPVRLDMNFRFGSAKAFLTSATGLRNAQTSKVQ